jgi:hypothetical protein
MYSKSDATWPYQRFAGSACRVFNLFINWRDVIDVAIRLESETWTCIRGGRDLGEEK